LIALRADPELQNRLEPLAQRSTSGQLTTEEHEEYESYVRAINVISNLQAKARNLLAETRTQA
jgi:hypothetical protein